MSAQLEGEWPYFRENPDCVVLDVAPGVVASGNFRKSTTVPVTTVSVRLSIERNQDRTISMYYNGRLLGTTDDVFAIGSPLVIYLYTATGVIIANVTELTVTIER